MSAIRLVLLLLAALLSAAAATAESRPVVVGSKAFTESVVLGEMARQLALSSGHAAEHRRELGGTRVLWAALLADEIDLYPEYTGTLRQEIFAGTPLPDDTALRAALAARGLRMSDSLGFQNTYALGMRADVARSKQLVRISDLRRHPELRFGFGNEFMDRADGWPGLRAHYRLPQTEVRGMSHDLAYRALASGAVDLIDLYSTDAEIAYYGLSTLLDDEGFFPQYDAVWLYRADLEQRAPTALAALLRLQGGIDAASMSRLNAAVKLEHSSEADTAATFLASKLQVKTEMAEITRWDRLQRTTLDHLLLVALSLSMAIIAAVPLGILAARLPALGRPILAAVSIVQTIPSLALFVFMIPLLGIGAAPAVAALFLYSLLPIVRNTYTGLTDLPAPIRESAEAMGLSNRDRLLWIELPLSARAILAGIKTAAVINVGTATLAALIGAGGYGQPILTGIRLDDIGLILEGAVPAALLALLVQGGFEWIERWWLPAVIRR